MNDRQATGWFKKIVIGPARDLSDKKIFHHVSLIALLAWVGLGSDGLSSACYGPEAAFLALKGHTFLSVFVALATVLTIVIICASYSQIIEVFPSGGGGYLVASKLLSPTAGVVSGCALIVDYVLTISISIASGADAIFSLLPAHWQSYKTLVASLGAVFLTFMNLRGAKESVVLWVPVFFLFLGTHVFAIVYGVCSHGSQIPELARSVVSDVKNTSAQVGVLGLIAIILQSYSLGAGTFTGIEAVSNGLPILREPRVKTGRKTMVYMGCSLGSLVGGLLLAYLLYGVKPTEGKTLNAVLLEQITATWPAAAGHIFVFVALIASGCLLFIAAQTGFLDGPRVLANMAMDRWFPGRFATLSDRLVTQNGVMLMGAAALVVLLCTKSSVDLLVVLYSINVFITFSLSQLGMVRHWWQTRNERGWQKKMVINGVGLLLTTGILISLCAVKFFEGGWVTLVVTGALIGLAFLIRRHYNGTRVQLQRLDDLVAAVKVEEPTVVKDPAQIFFDKNARTAVILTNGFNGLGLHTLFAILRMFPGLYRNFVFAQVGVVDAGNFKGSSEVENLRQHATVDVERYAAYMREHGYHAEGRVALGTDVVEEARALCAEIAERFPKSQFFAGQLVFDNESIWTRLLHNYVVFALQRRLYQEGRSMLILPIKV